MIHTSVWHADLVRILLGCVNRYRRGGNTAQWWSRLNSCTLYPRVVIAHNIFMIKTGQKLDFTCYLPVQLLVLWIQLNTFNSIHTTVQFITNLTKKTDMHLWKINKNHSPLNYFLEYKMLPGLINIRLCNIMIYVCSKFHLIYLK
jgi:hypothetical protein